MTESKAKAKTKGNPQASKSRKPATQSRSAPKSTVKSKTGAKANPADGNAASELIDERIRTLSGWRGKTLAEVRRMIHEADPEMVEEWKWRGTPVWCHAGNICTGEAYKEVVKLTFARGASLPDPQKLFNSSLEGNTRRAIDIREGEVLDAKAFKTLVQTAVSENLRRKTSPSKSSSKPGAQEKQATKSKSVKTAKATKGQKSDKVVLLSGGNPQIAKADGDAPVQAYIAAMPEWKRDIGRRLDALIVSNVPDVIKAVKWNSPFYGIEGQGWFFSFHVFNRYVKATFFRGTSLRPVPPGGTTKEARWIDIHEDDLDEEQMAKWFKQAAEIPGWMA